MLTGWEPVDGRSDIKFLELAASSIWTIEEVVFSSGGVGILLQGVPLC
jgi:hypothetical protein